MSSLDAPHKKITTQPSQPCLRLSGRTTSGCTPISSNSSCLLRTSTRTLLQTIRVWSQHLKKIEAICNLKMPNSWKELLTALGMITVVEADHSPLEQIFKKNVTDTPARFQRIILGCLKFNTNIRYKPAGFSQPTRGGRDELHQRSQDPY